MSSPVRAWIKDSWPSVRSVRHRSAPVVIGTVRDTVSPEVELIDGLSPAIAIEQRVLTRNPRSTVGTVTEIDDYFRLLFARAGVAHCPNCGRTVKAHTVSQIVDAVLALEVIEHVVDPADFLAAVSALVGPRGCFIGATLNRTPRSFALAIVGAEYLFGWLPPGTHDWRKLLRPSEFVLGLRRNGLVATQLAGLIYDPIRAEWSLSPDLRVNYMIAAARR